MRRRSRPLCRRLEGSSCKARGGACAAPALSLPTRALRVPELQTRSSNAADNLTHERGDSRARAALSHSKLHAGNLELPPHRGPDDTVGNAHDAPEPVRELPRFQYKAKKGLREQGERPTPAPCGKESGGRWPLGRRRSMRAARKRGGRGVRDWTWRGVRVLSCNVTPHRRQASSNPCASCGARATHGTTCAIWRRMPRQGRQCAASDTPTPTACRAVERKTPTQLQGLAPGANRVRARPPQRCRVRAARRRGALSPKEFSNFLASCGPARARPAEPRRGPMCRGRIWRPERGWRSHPRGRGRAAHWVGGAAHGAGDRRSGVRARDPALVWGALKSGPSPPHIFRMRALSTASHWIAAPHTESWMWNPQSFPAQGTTAAKVVLISARDLQRVIELRHDAHVNGLSFSPDGATLAVAAGTDNMCGLMTKKSAMRVMGTVIWGVSAVTADCKCLGALGVVRGAGQESVGLRAGCGPRSSPPRVRSDWRRFCPAL